MKFTISWLKDHLDFNAPIEELTIALNKGGIEVEGVEDYEQKLKDFSYTLAIIQSYFLTFSYWSLR